MKSSQPGQSSWAMVKHPFAQEPRCAVRSTIATKSIRFAERSPLRCGDTATKRSQNAATQRSTPQSWPTARIDSCTCFGPGARVSVASRHYFGASSLMACPVCRFSIREALSVEQNFPLQRLASLHCPANPESNRSAIARIPGYRSHRPSHCSPACHRAARCIIQFGERSSNAGK